MAYNKWRPALVKYLTFAPPPNECREEMKDVLIWLLPPPPQIHFRINDFVIRPFIMRFGSLFFFLSIFVCVCVFPPLGLRNAINTSSFKSTHGVAGYQWFNFSLLRFDVRLDWDFIPSSDSQFDVIQKSVENWNTWRADWSCIPRPERADASGGGGRCYPAAMAPRISLRCEKRQLIGPKTTVKCFKSLNTTIESNLIIIQ